MKKKEKEKRLMKMNMGEERIVDGMNPIKERIGNKQAI